MNYPIVELAKQELRLRRVRERLFGSGLFADPCWDILLDAFVAEETGKTTSVSDACRASVVPATTALRYLAALEAAGKIQRYRDPHDGRRALIRLTAETQATMLDYLGGAGENRALAGHR